MIQPIIIQVESQKNAVRRLVDYCQRLDGTTVKVIPLSQADDETLEIEHPSNEKACRAAFALRRGAMAMKGKPFIWLEHDSIPLKKGWVAALSAEYKRLGKPFLLSSDSHPPYDLIGGIGIYPGETHWMIPVNIAPPMGSVCGSGWDLWLERNLSPLIAKTPIIQHSYGTYDLDGKPSQHTFPRDAAMLRKEAVVFHRDARQDLISMHARKPSEKHFFHSGDLGDVVYHMAVIEALGGGALHLGSEMGFPFPTRCREPMTPARVANIVPLLMNQRYISNVEICDGHPNPEWINLNRFREIFRGNSTASCMSLQRACFRRFGIQPQDETKPWLEMDGRTSRKSDYIAVARSPRYHNPDFPWHAIVQRHANKIRFIGPVEEHVLFCAAYGNVKRIQTPNLLDVARTIYGSALFIGNQSCPYAIAEGLKHPAILECWPHEPNCLFQRQHLLNMTVDKQRILEFIDSYL